MSIRRMLVLVVPGPLATRTGGYEYDRRIAGALRALGWTIDVVELDGSFPRPTRTALDLAADAFAQIPDGTPVVIDGLALGSMPEQIAGASRRLKIVDLVHMPLAADVALDAASAAHFEGAEARALSAVVGAIVTGTHVVGTLQKYGVPQNRIALVAPGTERAPLARGSRSSTLHLVSMGAVTVGKGHILLVRALAAIPSLNWRLTCAGSLDRDPDTVAKLRSAIHDLGLSDRVSLVGELDDAGVAEMYDEADMFALATLGETYGMAVAEALARGLPVVSTRTGAIRDLVGEDDTAAGLLVPPGDVCALTNALSRVIADGQLRERMAANARRRRESLPTWEDAGEQFAGALERFLNEEERS